VIKNNESVGSLQSPCSFSLFMSLVVSTLTNAKDNTIPNSNDKLAVDKPQMALVSMAGSIAPLIQSARTITKDVASYWSEVALALALIDLTMDQCEGSLIAKISAIL
jgi:hypothetical protein